MTTSVALANMPSAQFDVSVNYLNQANLLQRSFSANGGATTSEYVFASGDPTTETSVLVSATPNTKDNTLRITISLKTIQIVTVDSVVKETAPIIASISLTLPGPSEDTSMIMEMIGTLYSLTFDGVTSKVPNLGILDALNRGITSDLFG